MRTNQTLRPLPASTALLLSLATLLSAAPASTPKLPKATDPVEIAKVSTWCLQIASADLKEAPALMPAARLAVLYAAVGETAESKRLISIVEKGVSAEPDTTVRCALLGNIAHAHRRGGDDAAYEKNIANARIVSLLKDQEQKNACAGILAFHQAFARDFDGVLKTVSAVPDPYIRGDILADVGDIYADLQLHKPHAAVLSLALEDANKVQDPPGLEPGPILKRKIVAAHAALGSFDAAYEIAHAMPPSFWKVQAFTALARAKAEAGDKDGARKFLSRAHAVPVARIAFDPYMAFCEIARAEHALDNAAGRAAALRDALDLAAAYRDDFRRAAALLSVASAQLHLGEEEGATASIALARQARANRPLPDQPFDLLSRAYGELAGAYAHRGDLDAARATARNIVNKEQRAYAHRMIAFGLCESRADDAATITEVLADNPLHFLIVGHLARQRAKSAHFDGLKPWLDSLESPTSRIHACISLLENLLIYCPD